MYLSIISRLIPDPSTQSMIIGSKMAFDGGMSAYSVLISEDSTQKKI